MTLSPRAGERQAPVVATQDRHSPDEALSLVLDATRALLWVASSEDVAAHATGLVVALGGTVAPAQAAPADALPIDISFGAGAPRLPLIPDQGEGRPLLEGLVAGFVRDAHRALELADRPRRLAEAASLDPLTGLSSRRMLGRALGRLGAHGTVIMIDVDHFKEVNDAFGHAEGDRVLRELGAALRTTARAVDRVGRYGGEEFVVLLATGDPDAFLVRLRKEWESKRPRPVTFSAGIAPAAIDVLHALGAADRALYRAKDAGRDQWQWAVPEDYK
jgi:diguanylate cyclase (GGDEF)-like protein